MFIHLSVDRHSGYFYLLVTGKTVHLKSVMSVPQMPAHWALLGPQRWAVVLGVSCPCSSHAIPGGLSGICISGAPLATVLARDFSLSTTCRGTPVCTLYHLPPQLPHTPALARRLTSKQQAAAESLERGHGEGGQHVVCAVTWK